MDRLFTSTCPKCRKSFFVAWKLRHAGVKLICPFCGNRHLPEESAELDEREE
jgi:predicted nucleic-acid-binding Zn-ribbon protein